MIHVISLFISSDWSSSSTCGGEAGWSPGTEGFVFSRNDRHFADTVELFVPQDHFGQSDDPAELGALLLKRKGLSLHGELMFTRPFGAADIANQGRRSKVGEN
ncbi:hypothetical protein AA13594_2021 [Gluconacetobacter azotocaptans DSM 13594]|nr:hypothetical protein AA13594_2021 [Gluconacetobacter azotocaptans DSM 13594]